MIDLLDVTQTQFGDYCDYAEANLARELKQALLLTAKSANTMGKQILRSVLPVNPTEIREGVFLRSVSHEGKNIGFALFGLQSTTESRYFIWDIVIDEEFRGRGFGTATLKAIETHALKRGAKTIELSVFAQNHTAESLYSKLGFRAASTRMIKALEA